MRENIDIQAGSDNLHGILKRQFITLITLLQRLQYSPLGKTAVIYPLSFLAGLAGGMVVLGMVFFADDQLKASPPQIGLLGAIWTLFYVFGCLGLRPLSVRLHPRHSMLLATLLLAGSVFMISPLLFVLPLESKRMLDKTGCFSTVNCESKKGS